jgi:hypothetical protein
MTTQHNVPSTDELKNSVHFTGLHPKLQHAYLVSADKDYASAPENQQRSYREFIRGKPEAETPKETPKPEPKEPQPFSALNLKLLNSLGISKESRESIQALGLDQPAITKLLSQLSRKQILAMTISDKPLVRRSITKASVAKATRKRPRL